VTVTMNIVDLHKVEIRSHSHPKEFEELNDTESFMTFSVVTPFFGVEIIMITFTPLSMREIFYSLG